MKIRKKFAIYNIAMLITPIILIGVISVCMLIVFVMKYPVEELNITRASLIDPMVLASAIGDFFAKNPGSIRIIVVWFFVCIALIAVSTTIATKGMSKSIEKPMEELSRAACLIKNGDLDFEVLGSSCEEIDDLCVNFDNMRKELKAAKSKEKRMNYERSMMIANISHDLKTPITSIKGYVEGIRDGIANTPDRLERYINTIYQKAQTIEDIVNNLSVYSKLEMSRDVFVFETIDLNSFLVDFAEKCKMDLMDSEVKFIDNISEDKAFVRADVKKLERVFSNLVDNAVKYRGTDEPFVEVKTFVKDNGVYVCVNDNGIGIDEDELDNVFLDFYRADASRSIKGSGLGLGIVKQIVTKHGGKIWLKSLEKGTSATVYLPMTEYGGTL